MKQLLTLALFTCHFLAFGQYSTWQSLGNQSLSSNEVDDITRMQFDNTGAPYVAFVENGKAVVKKFNGSSWINIGAPGPIIGSGNGSLNFNLAFILYNNEPYLAFADSIFGGKTSVMKYDGNNWVYVGGSGGITNQAVYSVSMAIDNSGKIYVAQSNLPTTGPADLIILEYNGTSWITYSSVDDTFGGAAMPTDISINPITNQPLVSYKYYGNSTTGFGVRAKYFDGTNWNLLGTNVSFAMPGMSPSIAFDNSGDPYITYRTSTISQAPQAVSKYNPGIGDWEAVGSNIPGNSPNYSIHPKIAFSGTPYLFKRNSTGNSEVLTFDGTNWVNVGISGFSPTDSCQIASGSIIIDNLGTPYVSFKSNSNSIAVMKYDFCNQTDSNISISSCDSLVSPSGLFTWYNSGTFNDTIPNVKSCDSVITVNLTINSDVTSSFSLSACKSYTSPSGNYIWTNSGIYNDTIASSNGCDSIITIDLTITTVDTAVSQNGNTLTANEFGFSVSHQWVDCNNNYANIVGATNQSFTPLANGSYAVIVDLAGCIDTSSCKTIADLSNTENLKDKIKLYPNPVSDILHLDFNDYNVISIELMNAAGTLISKSTGKIESIDVRDLPKGVYFIKINTEIGSNYKRFIKQ